MKINKFSVINIVIGIVLISNVIINDIQDEKGFALFLIGIIMLVSGMILNKKIRDIVINFIINFF